MIFFFLKGKFFTYKGVNELIYELRRFWYTCLTYRYIAFEITSRREYLFLQLLPGPIFHFQCALLPKEFECILTCGRLLVARAPLVCSGFAPLRFYGAPSIFAMTP